MTKRRNLARRNKPNQYLESFKEAGGAALKLGEEALRSDYIRPGMVYATNIIAGTSIGHPYGAVLFGAERLANYFRPGIENNVYVRVVKGLSAIGYGIHSLLSIANGSIGEGFLAGTMAAELGYETYKSYKSKRSVSGDLGQIKKDLEPLVERAEALAKKGIGTLERRLDDHKDEK